MKSQTIYFLQSLYEAKPEYCQMILQSVARQLIQVCEQYEKYCGLNEMWILDEKGQKILEKLSEQKMDLLNLNIPEDAFAKMKKLECIFQEIMQMQEECCLEIHSTGGLDPDKLHLVADSWKDSFMYRLADQIIIELYRILVYGSEEQFYSVPSLFEMNLDFEKIYPVYRDRIYPVIMSLPVENQKKFWAFEWKDRIYEGSAIMLNGYYPCVPDIETENLVPGKINNSNLHTLTRICGRGNVTNVTPYTILDAQEKGIQRKLPLIRPELFYNYQTVDEILETVFSGKYYVIEPEELVLVLNQYKMYQKAKVFGF